ncbi:MAG: hypothetical protein ABFE07_08810 [Armatimonadia bacterium]
MGLSSDQPGKRFPVLDYGGYLSRLIVLSAAFGAGLLLNHLSTGRPYFGLLVLAGVILVCLGIVLGPHSQMNSGRLATPLFDLAWIMFAMYLTDGLSSFLLPLLYIVVATAAMKGNRWEVGMSLGGAVTGIFLLAQVSRNGTDFPLAVAQATLLAAGALAVRLTVAASIPVVLSKSRNEALYTSLLQNTSDAVLSLEPETWHVLQANPAATSLLSDGSNESLGNQELESLLLFKDRAFARTSRARLAAGEAVQDAATYATTREGRELVLRVNLQPLNDENGIAFVQAIIEVSSPEDVAIRPQPVPRDDFSVNYIPSLTHELNNHLAAIRLSAELAATTGRAPNFEEMQQQVDHCQDVLQTVVLQILRSAAPQQATDETPAANPHTVIERALLLTRPQVLTAGIQLQVSIPPGMPAVAGFNHELQEALVRIIIHSIKAMTGREPPRTLSLAATVRERFVELVILDLSEGLGIRDLAIINGKQNILPRAQDRNWVTVRDAICRFGGELQASNGLNGGMRLRLLLPVVQDTGAE